MRVTSFSKARSEQASASTLNQLIEIGKRRGYRFPEFWAKQVMKGRKK